MADHFGVHLIQSRNRLHHALIQSFNFVFSSFPLYVSDTLDILTHSEKERAETVLDC